MLLTNLALHEVLQKHDGSYYIFSTTPKVYNPGYSDPLSTPIGSVKVRDQLRERLIGKKGIIPRFHAVPSGTSVNR